MQIAKRNGTVVDFDRSKIEQALAKAFLAHGRYDQATVRSITDTAVTLVQTAQVESNRAAHIEEVQNFVEQALLEHSQHAIARSYMLYRSTRAKSRAAATSCVRLADGSVLCKQDLVDSVVGACHGLDHVDPEALVDRTFRELFDGATRNQVSSALILAARTHIERAPEYSKVAARLLLSDIYSEVMGNRINYGTTTFLQSCLIQGVDYGIYDERLINAEMFDLNLLATVLTPDRDLQFDYLGLQTLYDRYLVQIDGRRIEAPQYMFMRIAMGLALNEEDPTGRAMEFYDLLSSFDYMASTPTLFNAGLKHSQLSSCYLSTVPDDLSGIFNTFRDNALLSKFAGGIGNDWTPVRALGSFIKGTNGQSQGVVPFLKIDNDTAVAVNQGGKRKGAICSYLETWHMDVEEFIELRKNTGDDRRRTHDMNTANWIPDLFMMRVEQDAKWTLFSPDDAGHLHDLYGKDFKAAYEELELRASLGEIKNYRVVEAKTLWRKMLTMLFETGHPWITFKDPCNLRSPQKHVGVVHSSNLCTEITLNTKASTYNEFGDRKDLGEVAVCNLGSVNLPQHYNDGRLDLVKLQRTINTAVRMLDNVIDLNYYPVPEARSANMQHRPIGLGMMGFQDVLYKLGVPYNSPQSLRVSAETSEAIAYYAYLASSHLAAERGRYESYEGSDWSKGILPHNTVANVIQSRGVEFCQDILIPEHLKSLGLDWGVVYESVAAHGMRNSNVMAIAPTATIANIVAVIPSIEPAYQNLYVKDNLSGAFTVINEYLVRDLRALNLWDDQMRADLKQADGSVQNIERIPDYIRELYRTAFELDQDLLVDNAVVRQWYIDQAISLNLYVAGATGRALDQVYRRGWRRGLKTNYYLRTTSASRSEKSTGKGGDLNAVKRNQVDNLPEPEVVGAVCTMRPSDPGFSECEACS